VGLSSHAYEYYMLNELIGPPAQGWLLHHSSPWSFLLFVFVFLVLLFAVKKFIVFVIHHSFLPASHMLIVLDGGPDRLIDVAPAQDDWWLLLWIIFGACTWMATVEGLWWGQRRQWRQWHQGPWGSGISTRRQQDAGVTGIFGPVFNCCFHFFWPPWLIVVFVFLVFQQPGIICIGWLIVFISFSVPPWLIILPLFFTPGGIATGGNNIHIINIIQNRYIDYWFLFYTALVNCHFCLLVFAFFSMQKDLPSFPDLTGSLLVLCWFCVFPWQTGWWPPYRFIVVSFFFLYPAPGWLLSFFFSLYTVMTTVETASRT